MITSLLNQQVSEATPSPAGTNFFTFADELGQSLSEITRLDTMVTVVDAAHFLDQYREARKSKRKRRKQSVKKMSELLRTFFVDQVEFAVVILINKIDLRCLKKINEIFLEL